MTVSQLIAQLRQHDPHTEIRAVDRPSYEINWQEKETGEPVIEAVGNKSGTDYLVIRA